MGADTAHQPLIFDDAALILGAVMFVVGSICLLPGPLQHIKTADLLYILGSCIYLCKSLHLMLKCHKRSRFDLRLDGHELAMMMADIFHFIASVIFCAGAILWWPDLYDGDVLKMREGWEVSATLLIVGSLGFVIAGLFNAMALSKKHVVHDLPGERGRAVYKMELASLFCGMIGGVLFVTASSMYRPSFQNFCGKRATWRELIFNSGLDRREFITKMAEHLGTTEDAVHAVLPTSPLCIDVAQFGTQLYIVGSVFYVAQAMFGLLMSMFYVRAQRMKKDDAEGEADSATMQEESSRSSE